MTTNFFGISDEYLEQTYSSLFGVSKYLNGFDFMTLYKFPRRLREWVFEWVQEQIKAEEEAYEKAKQG